jgi:hypothetical protein
MDPITITLIGVGVVIIAGAAAIIFWPKIIKWAESNLFPWVKEHMPGLEQVVRDAYSVIDKFAAPAHAIIKDKWQQLRQYLLRQVEKFEQQSDHTWQLETTAWVRKTLADLNPDDIEVEEIRSVRPVAWEDLPVEVREAVLRKGVTTYEIDFTEARDAEINRLELTV